MPLGAAKSIGRKKLPQAADAQSRSVFHGVVARESVDRDKRRLATLNYDAPLKTEYWDPDGSTAFKQMFERIEKEGTVLERP